NKIRDAFDKKDWESLAQLVHSLKGSAGSIGADELYKAAMDLEMASKEAAVNPPALSLIDGLDISLDKVLRSLQTIADTRESEALRVGSDSLDKPQFKKELRQLADALKMADPEAIRRQIEKVREHTESSALQELESRINNYDYDEALGTINKILKIEN
ncbi:MAG: hypothetical protein BA867_03685, partial [Desulfobacterales bacterium S5133MH16]